MLNLEKVAAFSDGAAVSATYSRIGRNSLDSIYCLLPHPHESWITVTTINAR